MVILTTPAGQRSNQFFQHVHFDAFCRENQISFYNPFIQQYFDNYPNLKQSTIELPENQKPSRLNLLIHRFIGSNFSDSSQILKYENKIKNSKLLYCKGWFFRSDKNVIKHQKSL